MEMMEPRQDILISRAVTGELEAREWTELAALAAADATIWGSLALAQRQQALLERAVANSLDNAERIEPDFVRPSATLRSRGNGITALGRVAAWSGWAAAACIAFIWLIGFDAFGIRDAATQPPVVQPVQYATAEDALQAYLALGHQSGQVVGEMPSKLLLDSRPAAGGQGYDVLYVRPILEKTRVPDLYQATGRDEQGRPTLVHYEQPGRRPM